jgi:hypothetical protein
MGKPWYRRGPSLWVFSNYWPVNAAGWIVFFVFGLAFLAWWIFADEFGLTNHQPVVSLLGGLIIVIGWQAVAWSKSH